MIYLNGASGHAMVIIEILEQSNKVIAGLIDNDPEKKSLLGYPVFQQLSSIFDSESKMIISIGNNAIRKRIAEENNISFETAVHPLSNISKRSSIGVGSVVMASVTVNCKTVISKHVILNTNCSIDHDCNLGNYVHISPNVALAGNVTVGEGSHIGIGACVIQGIVIGKWVTIGAGAVIIDNIPDYAVVVGNPGKIIKYNYPNI